MSRELEKRFSTYLKKTIQGYSNEKKKQEYYKNSHEELTEKIEKQISLRHYSENEYVETDVNYMCPEKAFSNPLYYQAMLKVPLLQKQALYLLVVDNLSIQQVSKILKVSPTYVKTLKKLAIKNFKKNLEEMK